MIPLIIAEATQDAGNWGQLITGLTSLITLALVASQFVRAQSGKANERQVEPTQLAGIQSDLKGLTDSIGEIVAAQAAQGEKLNAIKDTTENLRTGQQRDVDSLYKRVNAISEDLAGVKERVGAIERQCPKC